MNALFAVAHAKYDGYGSFGRPDSSSGVITDVGNASSHNFILTEHGYMGYQ